MLDLLGIPSRASDMSFSVRCDRTGLEYQGGTVFGLFAQRRNLFRPSFYRMLRDILRFNREAPELLDLEDESITLDDYLRDHHYSTQFVDHYLVPMGASIWSAPPGKFRQYPARYTVGFFRNHGLLNIVDRPQWRVIEGGSREYLKPLCAGFARNIRVNSPVLGVRRMENGIELSLPGDAAERFDHVVFACHSDQALAMLRDPTVDESAILSALPYRSNDVVLHTDTRLLPRNRRAWSSWNYLRRDPGQRAVLTYNMNILQGLSAPETFCVTLNDTAAINPHRILGRFSYDHPVFTLAGMRAQERWQEINNQRTWYCGAYWRNGFHEDGVYSALRVASALGAGAVPLEQRSPAVMGTAA